MAAYYPYVIVALLLIYAYSTNAHSSTYYGSKPDIEDHLRAEKHTSPFPLGTDSVCDLEDGDKMKLCNLAVSHLIREEKRDEVDRLLGIAVNFEEPDIAEPPFSLCRDVRIEGLGISKPMYWCRSRWYEKKVPESDPNWLPDIGEIDGFFCAGSTKIYDRVYVFRTKDKDAREVQPVAELNDCTLDLDEDVSSDDDSD